MGFGVMRLVYMAICAMSVLAGCARDETVYAYGGKDRVWRLQSIDAVDYEPEAWLIFPKPGRLAGQGPCNEFQGGLSAPYPWFELLDMQTTELACPQLAAERVFFEGLVAMRLVEVSGSVLILSTETGQDMVFISDR